jgi:Sulfotransferase family/Aspartyl/Asparaginyl beta-hydroxylase
MKLRARFLQLPVLFDAARLAEEVAAMPAGAWRPHPQGYPGNDALPLITTNGDPASDARDGAMGPTPLLLSAPYLLQVLETLGATWGRSRLMRLSGAAEVTPHVDTDYYWREHMRIHVPIVTQPSVRFLCGSEEVNMGPGECWIFDTWSVHSVQNDATRARIHLVADTVGGDGLLTLIENGRSPGETKPGWSAHPLPARAWSSTRLAYESRNAPTVMTPWELRDHLSFLMSELAPGVGEAGAVGQVLNRLRVNWHALWARSGDDEAARPEYADHLAQAWSRLQALNVERLPLRNGMMLGRCLRALIFESALAGAARAMDAESRDAPGSSQRSAPPPPDPPSAGRLAGPVRPGRDPVFDRPVFIVSSPRSGSTLLFETLLTAPGLATVGGESHALIESIPVVNPALRNWESNRLTAADAGPATVGLLRDRFRSALRDREGRAPSSDPVRMLEKTPKNALRAPFLATAFPEARFIYLYRDPRPTLASMIEGWLSGGFRTYPALPGWKGPAWSFLLTPGWRELIGAPLAQVVARQWAAATQILLDDLTALPPDRWLSVRHEDFLAAPQAEILRLCGALGLGWDRLLGPSLPEARHTLSRPDPDKWRSRAAEIEAVRPIWGPAHERALAVLTRLSLRPLVLGPPHPAAAERR